MCFSPDADAVVGGIVVVIGVDALRHVREPKQILLASLPLLFGLHQLDEAFVWWGLQGRISESIGRVGIWIYLLFALAALPALVPIAVFAVERSAARRRVIGVFTLLGIGVGYLPGRRALSRFGQRRDRRAVHRVRRQRVESGWSAHGAVRHRRVRRAHSVQLPRHRRPRCAQPGRRPGAHVADRQWLHLVVVLLGRGRERRDRPSLSAGGEGRRALSMEFARARRVERNVNACAFSWSEPVV